jgi:hypothetical protein
MHGVLTMITGSLRSFTCTMVSTNDQFDMISLVIANRFDGEEKHKASCMIFTLLKHIPFLCYIRTRGKNWSMVKVFIFFDNLYKSPGRYHY